MATLHTEGQGKNNNNETKKKFFRWVLILIVKGGSLQISVSIRGRPQMVSHYKGETVEQKCVTRGGRGLKNQKNSATSFVETRYSKNFHIMI